MEMPQFLVITFFTYFGLVMTEVFKSVTLPNFFERGLKDVSHLNLSQVATWCNVPFDGYISIIVGLGTKCIKSVHIGPCPLIQYSH